MQRAAVVLARCIAFVETYDLSPNGHIFFPEVVKELVDRYHFMKFPREYADFDELKGVEFLEGRWNDDVIWRLTIYSNGILLDTRSNTKRSRELIEEALAWARSKFGLNYTADMIKREAYVSQVTFHSDISFDSINPALERLAQRITSAVSEIHKQEVEYQTTAVFLQHDQLKLKNPLAPFTIAPRVETPLSEHKYFSEAPLPTDLHWELLEEFEARILSQRSQQ